MLVGGGGVYVMLSSPPRSKTHRYKTQTVTQESPTLTRDGTLCASILPGSMAASDQLCRVLRARRACHSLDAVFKRASPTSAANLIVG